MILFLSPVIVWSKNLGIFYPSIICTDDGTKAILHVCKAYWVWKKWEYIIILSIIALMSIKSSISLKADKNWSHILKRTKKVLRTKKYVENQIKSNNNKQDDKKQLFT